MQHTHEHTIKKMCEVLGVSPSGYHAYKNRKDQGETEREKWNRILDERILFHFTDNLGVYGSPRIHNKLVEEDKIVVSQKKVANRMRELGLFATRKNTWVQTTDSDHSLRTFDNKLNREFQPKAPNQAWATDITYVHTGEGFIYLNPILDLFSKRVISYEVDDRMDLTLPLRALEKAIILRNPKPGWIHHSDRGSQYCSNKYIEMLESAEATISMSRKANPFDNACVESFFASLKKEYLYRFVFKTKAEARVAIDFYIEFYNRKRTHSTLNYATPNSYELAYELAQNKLAIQGQLSSA